MSGQLKDIETDSSEEEDDDEEVEEEKAPIPKQKARQVLHLCLHGQLTAF